MLAKMLSGIFSPSFSDTEKSGTRFRFFFGISVFLSYKKRKKVFLAFVLSAYSKKKEIKKEKLYSRKRGKKRKAV